MCAGGDGGNGKLQIKLFFPWNFYLYLQFIQWNQTFCTSFPIYPNYIVRHLIITFFKWCLRFSSKRSKASKSHREAVGVIARRGQAANRFILIIQIRKKNTFCLRIPKYLPWYYVLHVLNVHFPFTVLKRSPSNENQFITTHNK